MKTKSVTIPITETDIVSGRLTIYDADPAEQRHGFIFAHGSANDMDNTLLVELADRLARAGHFTLRFNFLYKEKGKKSPDSQKVLEKTWTAVVDYFKKAANGRCDQIIAVGKSMGGRVASQMAAEGNLPVDRLIFLGYPLHAPGKKDKLRDAHLHHIRQPMLFFSGTRDPFCDLTLLPPILMNLKVPWNLKIIEDGDHSLTLPKSRGDEQELVYDQIYGWCLEWLDVK